jgi:dTMP kinase
MDGAGKTTQSNMLSDRLNDTHTECTIFNFPDYKGFVGRSIKKAMLSDYDAHARALLMAADRYEHAQRIRDNLSAGVNVICNRYSPSNLVYGTALGMNSFWLEQLETELPQPDLVFVLLIEPDTIRKRRVKFDSFESDSNLIHRVRALYGEFAQEHGWIIINADREVWDISRDIFNMTFKTLKLGS